jgi:hypothetical protein
MERLASGEAATRLQLIARHRSPAFAKATARQANHPFFTAVWGEDAELGAALASLEALHLGSV